MFNKDDLIIPVNEYVSAATINLDCIDVCESIVGQLVYLYECVKNQCHLDKNDIGLAVSSFFLIIRVIKRRREDTTWHK